MSSFIKDIEQAVASVLSPISGLQVLERETDDVRESQSVVIKAQIEKEYIPGTRIFEIGVEVEFRSNRSEHDHASTDAMFQNVFSALLNTNKDALSGSTVTFFSWYPQTCGNSWAEDVSIQLIKIRTHVQPV